MKKITFSGVAALLLSATTVYAGYQLGGSTFNSPIMNSAYVSSANGGSMADSNALRDGVGVKIFAVSPDKVPDLSKINASLFSVAEGGTVIAPDGGFLTQDGDGSTGDVGADGNTTDPEAAGPQMTRLASGTIVCSGADFVVGESYPVEGEDQDTLYTVVDSTNSLDAAYDLGSLKYCVSKVSDFTNFCISNYCADYYDNMSTWDTSSATTFFNMFSNSDLIGLDMSAWNTSSVTTMESAFNGTTNTPNISSWDFSAVTTMAAMFRNSDFNSPISSWNVGPTLTSTSSMFEGSLSFNQSIIWPSTTSLRDLSKMFYSAQAISSPISLSVFGYIDFTSMFQSTSFNSPLSFSTASSSAQATTSYMFADNTVFNREISLNKTFYANPSDGMFKNAISFNSPISFNIRLSQASGMSYMFYNAGSFNQDLSINDYSGMGEGYPPGFWDGATSWQDDFKPTF